MRKHKLKPRDFYAENAVLSVVYGKAVDELKDAMDIAYLTGQCPADVRDGALEVTQNKTKKRLRNPLDRENGARTQLGTVIDRIRSRSRKVRSLYIIATKSGVPFNQHTLRVRFDAARVRQFQFIDIRPKVASAIGDVMAASKLLGHTEQEIMKTVYIRAGETVKPTG